MSTTRKPAFNTTRFGSLLILALIQSCGSELPPAPPPAAAAATPSVDLPEPPLHPPPPPLTGDSSQCVVRRFQKGKSAWDAEVYEYDAQRRVLSGAMHFDAEGRMTRWDMSDTFRTHTYDAHGNLYEEANWRRDKLVDGTRWNNRYEGEPLRIAATDVSDFRKPKQRNKPHTLTRYTYDASGRIESVAKERGRITELVLYTWDGDRIVAVQGSLGSLHSSSNVPYHVRRTYEYDERGRLKVFTVDGMLPHREGATADGKPDHVATLVYDAAGRLERMEGDGWGGDVAPEDPDGKPDQITLLSPPCDPLVKLAPQLFRFPELHLPRSIAPPLR